MKPKTLLYCLCFIAVTGAGCRNTRITRTDTPTSGIATVVSDDCFGNIFGEEIDVFEALNREASLLPVLMGEAQAVQLLLNDSVRLAVLARDLTDAEKGLIHSRNRELSMVLVRYMSDIFFSPFSCILYLAFRRFS